MYSNLGGHLVAAVLREAVGGSVLDYAREKLFGPLGIDTSPALEPVLHSFASLTETSLYLDAGFAWPVDRAGVHLGESLLKLRPATWQHSASWSSTAGAGRAGSS